MNMYLDPSRVILGTFGQIFIDGNWQSNLNHMEANVEVDKRELNLVGTDWATFKQGRKRGTGTISGYKVTSDMIKRGFSKFEIISKLDDPEAYGFERIRLSGVMPDRIQLANWTAGEEVAEETPFTFESYELLDPIVAS
ncbi:phage tail tube protein [Paenibacillus apii]|uniref:phage tail tube protein n=1 Tax=Paenibacillus apii TaxID=1850370 RepID=UPI00143B7A92|nr:phage tail tube protein [Paenibacillus apii]NJJ37822.1 phage tail tube protein [Paenibacillus apii]